MMDTVLAVALGWPELILTLLILVSSSIVIGGWVYRDARSRGSNWAWQWGVGISFLFLGFIMSMLTGSRTLILGGFSSVLVIIVLYMAIRGQATE